MFVYSSLVTYLNKKPSWRCFLETVTGTGITEIYECKLIPLHVKCLFE